MKKEFTVGDMIASLQKLDPDLPLYDHFFDEEAGAECWFNLSKPKPKRRTIYLKARPTQDEILLEWTDERGGEPVLATKQVVILYPLQKGEVLLG
jgi:hypothetical protein